MAVSSGSNRDDLLQELEKLRPRPGELLQAPDVTRDGGADLWPGIKAGRDLDPEEEPGSPRRCWPLPPPSFTLHFTAEIIPQMSARLARTLTACDGLKEEKRPFFPAKHRSIKRFQKDSPRPAEPLPA